MGNAILYSCVRSRQNGGLTTAHFMTIWPANCLERVMHVGVELTSHQSTGVLVASVSSAAYLLFDDVSTFCKDLINGRDSVIEGDFMTIHVTSDSDEQMRIVEVHISSGFYKNDPEHNSIYPLKVVFRARCSCQQILSFAAQFIFFSGHQPLPNSNDKMIELPGPTSERHRPIELNGLSDRYSGIMELYPTAFLKTAADFLINIEIRITVVSCTIHTACEIEYGNIYKLIDWVNSFDTSFFLMEKNKHLSVEFSPVENSSNVIVKIDHFESLFCIGEQIQPNVNLLDLKLTRVTSRQHLRAFATHLLELLDERSIGITELLDFRVRPDSDNSATC